MSCGHETRMEWGHLSWCLVCDREVSDPVEVARPFGSPEPGQTFAEFLARNAGA